MSEPEELILEGAHFATRVARELWARHGPLTRSPGLPLASVRTRLELFVTALFQMAIAIAPTEPAAPRTWLSRLATVRTPDVRCSPLDCGTDGRRIYLPSTLVVKGDKDFSAIALYRLLAVQQGVRLVRGTATTAAQLQSIHTRDWFLLAEAAVVDRWIVMQAPGLQEILKAARSEALAHRREASGRNSTQLALERHVRAVLAADPLARVLDVSEQASVEESLAWAQEMTRHHPVDGRYRPVESVWYWGRMLEAPSPVPLARKGPAEDLASSSVQRARVAEMRRRPRPREATEDEEDPDAGTWVIRADEPQESVEDPLGLQRPSDRDETADPEGLADSLSDLPEARIVRTPGRPREVLRSGEEIQRCEVAPPATVFHRGIAYPEWDYRTGRYRQSAVIVREAAAPLGDPAWVTSALAVHSRLVRRVRARFERLRPRPVRLVRQTDGSEIDLTAYVAATADTRAGATVDGRLYVAMRPARRELAVALLLDVSASTDAWVSTNHRIVDVEKEALLVVCEALDALGDRYGVFAFSGEGAADVSVLPLKRFDERVGVTVRRRIAALDSDRFTRLGAPIRHLTAALCREPASRRLLLILSDGKPNDVDVYEGTYGVEDTRQAVAEARRQGVATFCLTVDRQAPRYASRIFGNAGFAVLHRTEQLPSVLVDVLRQLVRR